MQKIKTFIAIAVVAVIVDSCILTASAQVSSSTYVIWNFNETKAAAKRSALLRQESKFFTHYLVTQKVDVLL